MKQPIVVWDWNGTLLNDVLYTYTIVNKMLLKRELKTISIEDYRSLYSFPIKEYYRKLGFVFLSDNEYFLIIDEFNRLYRENICECNLYNEAIDILEYNKQKGIKQYILSGLNQKDLFESISRFELSHYFCGIYGSETTDANDKEKNAIKLLEENKVLSKNAIYVGDTIEDFKFANKLGYRPVLFSKGHQIINDLNDGVIIDSLLQIKKVLGD